MNAISANNAALPAGEPGMSIMDLLATVAMFQRLNPEDQQTVLNHLRSGMGDAQPA